MAAAWAGRLLMHATSILSKIRYRVSIFIFKSYLLGITDLPGLFLYILRKKEVEV